MTQVIIDFNLIKTKKACEESGTFLEKETRLGHLFSQSFSYEIVVFFKTTGADHFFWPLKRKRGRDGIKWSEILYEVGENVSLILVKHRKQVVNSMENLKKYMIACQNRNWKEYSNSSLHPLRWIED